MPRRKGVKTHPRCHLAPGGTWPDGPLADDAPPEAHLAQHIAKAFRNAYNARNLSLSKAAKRIGISRTTVDNILHGNTWLDLTTIDRIERKLNLHLWNRDHWPRPD